MDGILAKVAPVSPFAECNGHDSLSSVILVKVTRIPFLFGFAILSKQTKDTYHRHHIYHRINTCITNIIYLTNINTSKSFTNIGLANYLTKVSQRSFTNKYLTKYLTSLSNMSPTQCHQRGGWLDWFDEGLDEA
jgi:hypothetical protein